MVYSDCTWGVDAESALKKAKGFVETGIDGFVSTSIITFKHRQLASLIKEKELRETLLNRWFVECFKMVLTMSNDVRESFYLHVLIMKIKFSAMPNWNIKTAESSMELTYWPLSDPPYWWWTNFFTETVVVLNRKMILWELMITN